LKKWRASFFALSKIGILVSINLMPSSILKILGTTTSIAIHHPLFLDNRTIWHAEGILENVLVQSNDVAIPTDLVILENTPLILGYSFIATSRILMEKEKLTLQLGKEEIIIGLKKSIQLPTHHDDLLHLCEQYLSIEDCWIFRVLF
jgi:hypothetical protein